MSPSLAPATPTSAPTAIALGSALARFSTTLIGSPNVQVRVKPSVDLTVTERGVDRR